MSTTAKLSAIVFAAAVLVAGCGGGSGNSAAKSTTTTAPKTTTTTTTAPTTSKKGAKNGGGKAKGSKKAKGKGLKAYLGAKADIEAVAAPVLGLSVSDLDTQLMSGTSLADIATQPNVDIQKLTDAFTMTVNQKLNDAQAEGTFTDTQAQNVKQRLPQAIDKLLHRQFGQGKTTGSGAGSGSGPATSSSDQATTDTNS